MTLLFLHICNLGNLLIFLLWGNIKLYKMHSKVFAYFYICTMEQIIRVSHDCVK